jgi:hypothetical protein
MINWKQKSRSVVFILLLDVLFTAYRVNEDGRWIGLYATGLSVGWSITGFWLLLKLAIPFFFASHLHFTSDLHSATHRAARLGLSMVGLEMILGCGLSVYDVLLFALEPCACTPVPRVVWIRMVGNGVVLWLWMYMLGWVWLKRKRPGFS